MRLGRPAELPSHLWTREGAACGAVPAGSLVLRADRVRCRKCKKTKVWEDAHERQMAHAIGARGSGDTDNVGMD